MLTTPRTAPLAVTDTKAPRPARLIKAAEYEPATPFFEPMTMQPSQPDSSTEIASPVGICGALLVVAGVVVVTGVTGTLELVEDGAVCSVAGSCSGALDSTALDSAELDSCALDPTALDSETLCAVAVSTSVLSAIGVVVMTAVISDALAGAVPAGIVTFPASGAKSVEDKSGTMTPGPVGGAEVAELVLAAMLGSGWSVLEHPAITRSSDTAERNANGRKEVTPSRYERTWR